MTTSMHHCTRRSLAGEAIFVVVPASGLHPDAQRCLTITEQQHRAVIAHALLAPCTAASQQFRPVPDATSASDWMLRWTISHVKRYGRKLDIVYQ